MEHALPRRHLSRPGLLARLRHRMAHIRHRRRLRDLSDHILDDIGISRDAAEREASRPVWDVPNTWRR
ncbi:DUF1127 domain-containing protein [Defluviimonas sp. SAOS-178_SWC]|uniref:DUF1127 domain-containing protein n=1 Tax=Defluviimonas sp. SAOS-178_SWC TaxID=3121287 RepID=UPI003221B0C7